MTDLKPCECGNQAEMHWSRDGEASWAKCDACGREGPVRLTETKAITAWNKLPSERITGDKGRENPAEGAPPASGAPQDDLVASAVNNCERCEDRVRGFRRYPCNGSCLSPIIAERDAALAKLATIEPLFEAEFAPLTNSALQAKLAAAEETIHKLVNHIKDSRSRSYAFIAALATEKNDE